MDFDKAITFLVKKFKYNPSVFVVYTNALAEFPKVLEKCIQIPCHQIPHFPPKRKDSICPILIFGRYHHIHVLILQGRYHNHEGYSTDEIIFPVKIAYFLGCKTMFVTGAAGSINKEIHLGDIMILNEHVHYPDSTEFFRQKSDKSSYLYDENFRRIARKLAVEEGMDKYVTCGKYATVTGDVLKTSNEIADRLKTANVDAIGTSLIPEVSTALQLGMKTFGIVIMTDTGIFDYGNSPDPAPEEIAKALEPKKDFIRKLLVRFFEYCKDENISV